MNIKHMPGQNRRYRQGKPSDRNRLPRRMATAMGVPSEGPWLPDAVRCKLSTLGFDDDVRTWLLDLLRTPCEYDDSIPTVATRSHGGSPAYFTAEEEDPPSDDLEAASRSIDSIFDHSSRRGPPVAPRRRKHLRRSMELLNLQDPKGNKPRPVSMIERLRLSDLRISTGRTVDVLSARTPSNSDNSSECSDYQNIWQCTSGAVATCNEVSVPPIPRPRALINAISCDSVSDSSGDLGGSKQRIVVCGRPRSKQAWCTPECDPYDECHRELAATKSGSFVFERIYENIDFMDGNSEVISDSDSWRTPISASTESPVYENIRELLPKVVAARWSEDVLAWRDLLKDPYWNDDEEDEWVSPGEADEYARDQRPPFVIPRIKQFQPKPIYVVEEHHQQHHNDHHHHQDEEPRSPSAKEVRRKFEEEFSAHRTNDSASKITRNPSKHGIHDAPTGYLPVVQTQHIETSPIVIRKHGDNLRSGKSKSMMTGDKKELNKKYQYPKKLLPNLYDTHSQVKMEGLLQRTKITENGRKVRKKNWHQEYAVVTQTCMAFYKDKKTYDSTKDSLDKNNGAEVVIQLHQTLAGKPSSQQTSRSNAIVITQHDPPIQHLIYHDDPAVAQSWFDTIVKSINKLSNEYKCPENTNVSLAGTPSPTHKHVTKVKSSGKVTEGSAEDLSDYPEHAAIKSTLKKFFIRRPTKESLIKENIYKDEPVFGSKLEQVCPLTNPRVPEFVVRCIRSIESSEENMTADGLYRASGNLSQVQKIRVEVNNNNFAVLDKEPDVHVLTGALKLFFRELKEPLIPYNLFQPCLNASSNPVPEMRIKDFKEIISSMPECNRQTLKYLMEHLLRVTARNEQNRMHISNIAIVLGPTLLQSPPEASQNMAFECLQQNRAIEILMCDFDKIFKEDSSNSSNKKKK